MTDEQPQGQELSQDQAQLFHTLFNHLIDGVLKQAAIAAAELDVSVTEASGDALVASQTLLEVIDRIMPELADAVEAALETIPPSVITGDDIETILNTITGSSFPTNGNGEV